MKNLIVATNPATKRKVSAKQRAAAKRNIKKAQAANRRAGRYGRRGPLKKPARRRSTARRAPVKRKRARRRSNPVGFKGIINRQVIPAAVGGAGAVLDDLIVNAAFRFLPIPLTFQTGPMRHVAKALGAVLIGSFGSMLPMVSKRTADQLGAGAMTVVGYNVVRELAARFVPQLPLGEYLDPSLGYYGAGLNPGAVGEYLDPALSAWDSVGVGPQLTQGTPYLDSWPVESEEVYDYEM